MKRVAWLGAMVLALATFGGSPAGAARAVQVPTFSVDPMWPKPLPNRWLIGAVAGVAVDARDHVWIVHRPSTLQPNETRSIWRAAPPVLEFDVEGNVVSSWGGPGNGHEWPDLEHGIYVDPHDNVWLGGGGEKDAQILKFTRDGKFLLQIGRKGKSGGSNDTANLGGTANMTLDRNANELYVADGYVNHRVIVFDATTGAYKRHWGAYGRKPDDAYFTRAGERLPSPFSGAVQHENRPATTTLTDRHRRSSASSIRCVFQTMDWSTSATGRTIACRCFARTGRSSRKPSLRQRRSAAALYGISPSPPIPSRHS